MSTPEDAAWKKARDVKPSTTDPEPGVYHDVPFPDYCKIDAVNSSRLKLMALSPAHFRYVSKEDDAPFLRLGSFIHAGILEPERIEQEYVVIPERSFIQETQRWARRKGNRGGKQDGQEFGTPKASKVYKNMVEAFLAKHPGKQEVSESWMHTRKRLLQRMANNSHCRRLFKNGSSEVTIIAEVANVMCKCRVDWWSPDDGYIVDLKTFSTAADRFHDTIFNFSYHWQAAFYRMVVASATGWFMEPWIVGLETTEPFSVLPAPLDGTVIGAAERDLERMLALVRSCRRKKKWPLPEAPRSWRLPHWYQTNI